MSWNLFEKTPWTLGIFEVGSSESKLDQIMTEIAMSRFTKLSLVLRSLLDLWIINYNYAGINSDRDRLSFIQFEALTWKFTCAT
jgi:hypothetical protein